jgi:hypothetical protein
MCRVTSQENKELVSAQQIRVLLEDDELPFGKELCVEDVDSAYCKPAYLSVNRDHKNLVTIARARGTHTFYHEPVPKPAIPVMKWSVVVIFLKTGKISAQGENMLDSSRFFGC